jgi:hypothetical protein
MQDDATKKTNQSDMTDRPADRIEELAEKPISDQDAKSVKGGRARDDESPKESKK